MARGIAVETHNAAEWMQMIGLGLVMGAVGQGVRTIVGLKKLSDAASGANATVSQLIEASRLWVSLAIGAIAGVLAAVTSLASVQWVHGDLPVTGQQLFALAAAGYAGADFIEGFMSRVAPAAEVSAGENAVGVKAPATGNQDSADNADGSVG